MGLSAFNAQRAREAELQKTLDTTKEEPKEISTSPAKSGVEVEKTAEEVKPKKKKTTK